MKRFVLGLAVSLSFIICLGCQQKLNAEPKTNTDTQQQDAEEDPNTWDFGRIPQGEVVKHDFMLKNESEVVLNIGEINTSCGCTVSQVRKKTLLPQEEAAIEVKFKSKGYTGPVKQFVYVHTDNLDKSIIKYIIKAEVVR